MSSFQIDGCTALVTGANRGIGRALVEALAEGGAARIYAAARNPDSLEPLTAAYPDRIVPVQLDVTDEDHIQKAATLAQDVNLLINNAGVAGFSSPIATQDLSQARHEMEVNYFGLLNMSRAFAPVLARNGGGALVNVSSIGGLVSFPAFGTYCATKAAAHSITASIRGELAAQGTLVTGVYPGPIDTDMSEAVDMEKETPQHVAKVVLNALEEGREDVFPDAMAQQTHQQLLDDPKAVEKEFASFLPEPGS